MAKSDLLKDTTYSSNGMYVKVTEFVDVIYVGSKAKKRSEIIADYPLHKQINIICSALDKLVSGSSGYDDFNNMHKFINGVRNKKWNYPKSL